MAKKPLCESCGRRQGSKVDRGGDYDGIPLGPVERCDTCGRLACPDCQAEADCCFLEEDDHAGEPGWAPPGWRVASTEPGRVNYERVEAAVRESRPAGGGLTR